MITEKYKTSRTWTEIDTDAILNNLSEIKRLIPKETKVMAVVKANAYGHGANHLSSLLEGKVSAFGVASFYEAEELRASGVKSDILILGWTSPSMLSGLIEKNVMPAIFSYSDMKALSDSAKKLGKTARCFLALDTGMTRIGFPSTNEGIGEALACSACEGVKIEGVFSHYARSDERDKAPSALQKKKFDDFVSALEGEGLSLPIRSLDNSAGIIDFDTEYEMVRAGIILYGILPSDEVKDSARLIPALSLKTRVETVKTVPAGVGVSYGHTFVTDKETRIATLCIGYADGLPRSLSNTGDVIIRGKRARIIGRVCMDQVMVDVTGLDGIEAGDVVTVIGRDGDQIITADEVAKKAGTIPYEIICNLDRDRIPKIYL